MEDNKIIFVVEALCPACGGAGKHERYRQPNPNYSFVDSIEDDCENCGGLKTVIYETPVLQDPLESYSNKPEELLSIIQKVRK